MPPLPAKRQSHLTLAEHDKLTALVEIGRKRPRTLADVLFWVCEDDYVPQKLLAAIPTSSNRLLSTGDQGIVTQPGGSNHMGPVTRLVERCLGHDRRGFSFFH